MKYYSARKKKNDILSFATQWIPLESIMLTEIHQSPSKKIACFSWSAIIHTKYKNVIIRCESDIQILDHCAPPLFINLKNSFLFCFSFFVPCHSYFLVTRCCIFTSGKEKRRTGGKCRQTSGYQEVPSLVVWYKWNVCTLYKKEA